MTSEQFRAQMESFRDDAEREASELKDSYVTLERLSTLYERFSGEERARADQVITEWVLSDDEGVRFDAMALIRKFQITDAAPALHQLCERLTRAGTPNAPFELRKAASLVEELEGEARKGAPS